MLIQELTLLEAYLKGEQLEPPAGIKAPWLLIRDSAKADFVANVLFRDFSLKSTLEKIELIRGIKRKLAEYPQQHARIDILIKAIRAKHECQQENWQRELLAHKKITLSYRIINRDIKYQPDINQPFKLGSGERFNVIHNTSSYGYIGSSILREVEGGITTRRLPLASLVGRIGDENDFIMVYIKAADDVADEDLEEVAKIFGQAAEKCFDYLAAFNDYEELAEHIQHISVFALNDIRNQLPPKLVDLNLDFIFARSIYRGQAPHIVSSFHGDVALCALNTADMQVEPITPIQTYHDANGRVAPCPYQADKIAFITNEIKHMSLYRFALLPGIIFRHLTRLVEEKPKKADIVTRNNEDVEAHVKRLTPFAIKTQENPNQALMDHALKKTMKALEANRGADFHGDDLLTLTLNPPIK